MADVWVRQTEGKRDTEESFDRARVAAEAWQGGGPARGRGSGRGRHDAGPASGAWEDSPSEPGGAGG